MRIIVQRVTEADVQADGTEIARIGPGLLVLAGFGAGDDASCLAPMARKIAGLRIFPDPAGKFQFAVTDTGRPGAGPAGRFRMRGYS